MKKTLRKILALAVAGLMALSFTVVAFADDTHNTAYVEKDERTVGITLGTNNNDFSADDHTYTAVKLLDLYKVMESNGTQATDGTNPLYQYALTTGALDLDTLLNATGSYFKYDPETGAITLATDDEIATQKGVNENASDAAKLAALLAQLAQACVADGLTGTALEIGEATQLECGYYVIFETSNDSTDGYVATKPILLDVRVDDNEDGIAITLKDAKVEVDKVITNDDTNNDKQNVMSIGDVVSYEITTNFPIYEADVSNAYTTQKPIKFVISDTLSDGLDLDATSIVVTVNGTEVEAAAETFELDTEEHTFSVSFTPDFIVGHQGEGIVVVYEAQLNQNAAYNDAAGNGNTVTVEFSNNPEVNDEFETITTDEPDPDDPDNPEPTVKVYTFAFDLRKLDGAHSEYLEGVKFNLLNADNEAMKFVMVDANTYIYDSSLQGDDATGVTTDIMTVDGDITIIGLDEGTYTLHEVETVAGYSLLANDATIVVTADVEENVLTGAADLTTTYATILDDENVAAGETTSATTVMDGTSNLNVIVRNYKGISLPETGSIAAIVISGLGLLASGAGAAFVMNKKKDEE